MRMASIGFVFFFNDTATTEIYTLSLHDASSDLLRVCPPLGILRGETLVVVVVTVENHVGTRSVEGFPKRLRSEEHTSELQSRQYLVCRLLLEKKNLMKVHTSAPCRLSC